MKIAHDLRRLNYEVSTKGREKHQITVDGIPVHLGVYESKEGWAHRPLGSLEINVSGSGITRDMKSYGFKKQDETYKQLKDGNFAYDKIVGDIKRIVEVFKPIVEYDRAKEALTEKRDKALARLKKTFRLRLDKYNDRYPWISLNGGWQGNSDRSFRIVFGELTEDEADKLLTVAKKIGIFNKRKPADLPPKPENYRG